MATAVLVVYYNLDKGGHFVAWEQPQLLSEEVRPGFRSLRGYRGRFLHASSRRADYVDGGIASAA